MLTLRAPKKCAEHFRRLDPDTAVTEHYIRRLVANGDIPSIRNGTKILIAVEDVEAFIADSLGSSGTKS